MQNYNPAYIDGTANTCASSFKEHATTEMHKYAMILYKKQHSSNVCDFAVGQLRRGTGQGLHDCFKQAMAY